MEQKAMDTVLNQSEEEDACDSSEDKGEKVEVLPWGD